MSRIIDLTLPLRPGTRGVAAEAKFTVAEHGWNAATWHLYSHAGTHMDARIHFEAGSETIDQHTPARCMGPAWIVRLPGLAPKALLTVERLGTLAEKFPAGESLLLHTGWSRHVDDPVLYRDGLPRISPELARWCVERKVKLLGVEAPSVADVNNLPEVTLIHQILLGGGVTIVEGLANLDQLTDDRVFFAALPLRLAGGDGCPVRAFAVEGPMPDWNL
ncbi:MAG: cyclase family protein [Opitutaceae bacterium]